MEIRRSYDHLISTMGFPILVRWHCYIESGPRICKHCVGKARCLQMRPDRDGYRQGGCFMSSMSYPQYFLQLFVFCAVFNIEAVFPFRDITSLIARFMGPTWGPSGADRTQVGPMLAPWTLLSGLACMWLMRPALFTEKGMIICWQISTRLW